MYGQPRNEFKRLATPSVGMELGLSAVGTKGEASDFGFSAFKYVQMLGCRSAFWLKLMNGQGEGSCIFKLQGFIGKCQRCCHSM